MNRSPFTTRELLALASDTYAYRNKFGIWGIRQDVETVETVVRHANNKPLIASDYYSTPVDSVVVAEVVARSFTMTQHIDKAYNG